MAPAPITADGNVAGRPTDFVFVLVPDGDPATPGTSLASGQRLRLAMPPAFTRTPDVPVSADTDANLVLTRGWPQGAVKLAGQYEIAEDAAANALVVTALVDVPPTIKVIHLRGRTFTNPGPGAYPVAVEHVDRDGAVVATWSGSIAVVERPPPARLAPSNFHLPPGTNANFQTLAPDQVAPHPLGLLLWGEDAQPLDHVGVAPRDLARHPRYTGGLLIQDVDGDKLLDPASDRVVGGIIGAAPAGAKGQTATSPLGADGKPVLSGEVARDAGFPRGGGQPNPGLLVVQFRAGDQPGAYQPTFELLGGNAFQFTIRATN